MLSSALFRRFRLFPILTKMKQHKNGSAAETGKARGNGRRGDRLVWIDCEMTGLEVDTDRLVEIACIVTEGNLTPIGEFGPVAIRQPLEVIEGMSEWCKQTFAKNGLTERIKQSATGEREAENMVLEFLREHIPPGECPLAGNSVHADKVFLEKYMPNLCKQLHPYRIVDVSSVKELVKRWYADAEALKKMPAKKGAHLALDDIRESIWELEYYREHFFKLN